TDTGLYTCTATNAAGNASLSYSLHVQAPPQLLIGDGESPLTAVANDSLRIHCRAMGIPTPRIQWLKDGRPLGEQDGAVVSEDGGTLLITRVGLGHEGLYVCQGSNWAGVAQAEVQVLVQALPRIRGSSKAPRKVSVIKAGETVLECEAVGTPLPTVTWVKDGQPVVGGDGILLTEEGRQLRIPRAEVAHAGHYTCL
ncbi:HMCN2 protein, partial [Glareola pratincola]|nr:HMCN2 protein [Glareola pratincola]